MNEQLLFFSRFCAVAVNIRMVVTDAVPLITLAVARSLDYLLYPEQPVLIPDAVFHEATAAAGKLGTQEIIDWYRTRIDAVRIEPTDIFQREMSFLELQGGRLARDVGERAALELIRAYPLRPDERAPLLVMTVMERSLFVPQCVHGSLDRLCFFAVRRQAGN